MANTRVYELAKKLKLQSGVLVDLLNRLGIPVSSHMSTLSKEDINLFRKRYTEVVEKQKAMKKAQQEQSAAKKNKDSNRQKRGKKGNQNRNRDQENRGRNTQNAGANRNRQNRNKRNSDNTNRGQQTQGKNNQNQKNISNQNQNQSGSNKRSRRRNAFTQVAPPTQSTGPRNKNQKNKKKNYKDKKAERPIKVRDNSKRNKSKHVDYRKQREERKADQKKNKIYQIPELLTVGEFAEILDIPATEIIMDLMENGTMATINQQIDLDIAQIVAEDLGYQVQGISTEDVFEKIFNDYDNLITGNEKKRPPVVTVMGHVDHGKTSLLDKIRETNVVKGEAGGITQHIGAYTVDINDEKITFIDTPGHAAFTAMRSRGAQMTDIAVLVVAADDGVMPQTIEAINHAKAAEVPIIVAINKIDKDGANPERVKQDLTNYGILVEEWGGEYIAVPISAKKGTNIEDLLENILLVAEVEELKADPNRPARGSVIEAEVKKGKGPTATLLIQHGTLHSGDTVLSGHTYGKVKTMMDDKGKRIKAAGPSQPVEISGLSDLPVAGDDFIVLEDEKEARQLAQKRQEMEKMKQQKKTAVNLNDIFNRIQEGQISDINIIVKADVQGSVEALTQSLLQLNDQQDQVRVNVIHGAVGAVNETDVMLASTSDAIVIGFNVRADRMARNAAETEGIDVRYYSVIYDVIDDVKSAMEGLLEPEFVEKVLGESEIREVFKIPGGILIAGSYVTEGKVSRNDKARIIRDGVVIYDGVVNSLRRFKDDVKEVVQGFECGIGIENMNDLKVGDVIETYELQAVQRSL